MVNVMIGAPVHNRGVILPYYLEGIKNLDYPKENISITWIVNNCVDDSEDILRKFEEKWASKYRSINIRNRHYKRDYNDSRIGHIRRNITYPILADLRNIILREFLVSNCEYLFSLDTDIIVEPKTLTQLLSHQRDVVAALVKNGKREWNFLDYDMVGDRYHRNYNRVIGKEIFPVDLTGAAVVISRRSAEQGLYDNCTSGEDEGFARSLRKAGIQQFIDPNVRPVHLMREDDINGIPEYKDES